MHRGSSKIGEVDFWQSIDEKISKNFKDKSIRLDLQGIIGGNTLNLQIQYGNKSYTNVLLPQNREVRNEALIELFWESLNNRTPVVVPL